MEYHSLLTKMVTQLERIADALEAKRARKKSKKQTYTVVGVYTSGDASMVGERFADFIEAVDWVEAEKRVYKVRGGEVTIAGVIEGEHYMADEL